MNSWRKILSWQMSPISEVKEYLEDVVDDMKSWYDNEDLSDYTRRDFISYLKECLQDPRLEVNAVYINNKKAVLEYLNELATTEGITKP